MNRFKPHVYLIPEDDADRQIADGFRLHDQVDGRRLQIMPPVRGWRHVLETFETEYVSLLRNQPLGHVILLVDFDGHYHERLAVFRAAIPDDLRDRVFVLGASQNPEVLKQAMGVSLEQIGIVLADDCHSGTTGSWEHGQLRHNDPDRLRLAAIVKPILFAT